MRSHIEKLLWDTIEKEIFLTGRIVADAQMYLPEIYSGKAHYLTYKRKLFIYHDMYSFLREEKETSKPDYIPRLPWQLHSRADEIIPLMEFNMEYYNRLLAFFKRVQWMIKRHPNTHSCFLLPKNMYSGVILPREPNELELQFQKDNEHDWFIMDEYELDKAIIL